MNPKIIFASAVLALLGGCVGDPTGPRHFSTLSLNQSLPGTEIQAFYAPAIWARLRDEPYAGYVIVEGVGLDNHRLTRLQIQGSYPDDSKNALALALLKNVELHFSTLGSHLAPKAVAYVIFYDKFFEGKVAVIYAKQSGYSEPGQKGDAVYFSAQIY